MAGQGEDEPDAGEATAPPHGIIEMAFSGLGLIIILAAVVVLLVIVLSHLFVALSNVHPELPEVSSADQQVLGSQPLMCDFGGAEETLLILHCPGGERRALVYGVRPMPGISEAVAREGLAAGLDDYTRLSSGLRTVCELWALEMGPVAACRAEGLPSLADYLVATGRAGANIAALHALEKSARTSKSGLYADVAALRRADLRVAQGWLATALGLVGAMASILYTGLLSNRKWKSQRVKAREQLGDQLQVCNTAYGNWFRGDEGAEEFPAKLQELQSFLENKQAVGDWPREHARSVQGVRNNVGEAGQAAQATNARKDAVKKAWTKAYADLKLLAGES